MVSLNTHSTETRAEVLAKCLNFMKQRDNQIFGCNDKQKLKEYLPLLNGSSLWLVDGTMKQVGSYVTVTSKQKTTTKFGSSST